MCIIYSGTLDNTFSFYIGSSDWHHEVFLLPRLWSPGIRSAVHIVALLHGGRIPCAMVSGCLPPGLEHPTAIWSRSRT